MASHRDALHAQQRARLEQDYRGGRVPIQPDRITCALDMRGLDGPDVDTACGAKEPDVDHWEAGSAAPTWEQVEKLAWLTEMPVEFFFRPQWAGVTFARGWICGQDGCAPLEVPEPVAPYDPTAPLARVYTLPRRIPTA